jgi:hypothetical protein
VCFRTASSVSASSALWPTAGAKPYWRFANNRCECLRPLAPMVHCLKLVLQRCGTAPTLWPPRCFLSRASPLPSSRRNQWNQGFALTALDRSSVAAKSPKASASPPYVCSACAFRSHSVARDRETPTYTVHLPLKPISERVRFARFRVPVPSSQHQNPI